MHKRTWAWLDPGNSACPNSRVSATLAIPFVEGQYPMVHFFINKNVQQIYLYEHKCITTSLFLHQWFLVSESFLRSSILSKSSWWTTQFDIYLPWFNVNFVCQITHNSTNNDFKLIKRILRYVQGTLDHGIRLFSQNSLELCWYFDANWGRVAVVLLVILPLVFVLS